MTIYLIPGLGADGRMFEPQYPLPYPSKVLEFIEPLHEKEPLESYLNRWGTQIDTSQPFIFIGVSLGGILSIELAKLFPPTKHIIIASVKTEYELPARIKMLRKVPIYQLLNTKLFSFFSLFSKQVITLLHREYGTSFNDMLMSNSVPFLKWGMHQVIHWQNKSYPSDLIHIHGTKDRTFPIENISGAIIIENANHFMNIKMADEVNKILAKYLSV